MRATDYWAQALEFDDYVAQMTLNQELFRENYERTELSSSERASFEGESLRFLVLTEDFCGDSAQFIPVVGRLAQSLDNVEIRILHRDQHRELADGYRRKDGYQAIPVFILLDAAGDELGFLIERPERSNARMIAETTRFATENAQLEGIRRTYQNMPEATRKAVGDNMRAWRTAQQEQWTRWLLEDLAQILDAARTTTRERVAG